MNVAFYRQQYSKDCPRVDLDPDNAEAADLVGALIDERLRPLAPALLEAWDLDSEDRECVIGRARSALCDAGVVAIMYPPPTARD